MNPIKRLRKDRLEAIKLANKETNEINLGDEESNWFNSCNQQQSAVQQRIEHLKKVVLPAVEQALQDMDDIPAHDTTCLDKATFINTLHYLEAVEELQKAKQHYNSNGYQARKLGAFFVRYDSYMNKLQHHHLTTLQARLWRFQKKLEHQQIVQQWKQYACTHPKYQQWIEAFRLRSQQVHRRKDECDALEKRAEELQQLAKRLCQPKQDAALKQDINEHVLCNLSECAQKANAIVTNVLTNNNDEVDNNGLPSLGENLGQFDKRLPPLIEEVNRYLKHMQDLQQALTANPACPNLKKEFDECYSALKDNTEKLTCFIKQHYERQGTLYLLMSCPNYTEFSLCLMNLYNTLAPWYQSTTFAIPSQKHFANLKDKCVILTFNMMGEPEPATDPRTQQALNITNDAFNRALHQYTTSGGLVKITKKINGDIEYKFQSQAAKQHFISMALNEQNLQDRDQQQKKQKDTGDVVAAREEVSSAPTPSLGSRL